MRVGVGFVQYRCELTVSHHSHECWALCSAATTPAQAAPVKMVMGGRYASPPFAPCREMVGGSLVPPTASLHTASILWMPTLQYTFDFISPYRKGSQDQHSHFTERGTDSLSGVLPKIKL